MKHFTWNEYYEKFYSWSLSTQKNYACGLTDYGPAEEVAEVAQELAWDDEPFAAKFVEKAMAAGVRFTPDQIAELAGFTGEALAGRLAETASRRFSREELEEIYGLVDDNVFDRLCQKSGIDFFDDEDGGAVMAAKTSKPGGTLIDWDPEKDLPESVRSARENGGIGRGKPQKKPGFFSGLAAAVGTAVLLDKVKPDRHKGRCSGDCANCPPHYGYRYGRWYYGRGHQYGCEFGGNSGDGSM